MSNELHEKYAPVLRFARGERFFPASVNDFLSYSALYVKGQAVPIIPRGKVTLNDLPRDGSKEVFLRSVASGSVSGVDVVRSWGKDAIYLVYQWAQNPLVRWTEESARSAYDWFSDKTREATKHFWWNNLLLPKAFADKKSAAQAELPRFTLPSGVRESALEGFETSQSGGRNYTYYYRTMRQSGYLDLQYWFFYPYNDWGSGFNGFNDHEGDWEGFHVFFKLDGNRPVEPPAYVCYLGHESRMTKPWNHSEVEKVGTHPVIYVAAGSHASYPQARQYPLMALYGLIDFGTGDGNTLNHDQWRGRIGLDTVPWLTAYTGSWGTRYWLSLAWAQKVLGTKKSVAGEVSVPGVSAPRGPQFASEGGERETWGNPVAFAGIT
jgi:hypothetical protein